MERRPMSIDDYRNEIGNLSLAALAKGEDVQYAVELALGVAIRHSARIASHRLPVTPAILNQMDASLERARDVLRRA